MSVHLVAHGRRKGSVKSAPQATMEEPEQVQLGRIHVLTQDDWQRIQYALNKKQIEDEKIRKAREEREQLKAKSQALVKNWTNTVQGARLKKLGERARRHAREEEERCRQDVAEAKFQAERRREAIEKAKTQQYYQTDRVKGFHSALLFTEVLKEREAQLELKRLKEKAADGRDKEYLEKWQREYEDSIQKDQEKAAARIAKAVNTAKAQRSQIMEHMRQVEKEKVEEKIEGDNLRRLAVANALERQRLEQIAAQEQHEMMKENLRQIADCKKMREVQRLQEEADEEDCRLFAAGKRKMLKLRQERERQLHEEKQKTLAAIRDRLSSQLKALKDDEEERLARAVVEREEKLANEDAEKEAAAREMQRQIAEHRADCFRRRETEARENRMRELEMTRVRKEADELFRKNEAERRNKVFEKNKDVAAYHLKQARENSERERDALQAQLRYDAENVHLIELEEQQFQNYAKEVIDHCEKGGRNTYPLKKAARAGAGGGLGPQFPGKAGIRPSYQTADNQGVQLPNYKRDSTDKVKETINGDGNTHNRMGFVW